MKGLSRYLKTPLIFCLIGLLVIILNVLPTEADQGNITVQELVEQKKGELNHFVEVVQANSQNCDALKDCSGGGCSRLSCYTYGTRDDPNYKYCVGVKNNSICGPHCHLRNFDYSKGFVRLVDKSTLRSARTVCTHRSLDDHFKNSSMNDSTHFFRVFFGAVDGTTRIYPGADEADCSLSYDPRYPPVYDPRVRPWFVQSTYVHKAVALLIDSGAEMRKPGNTEILPGTNLNKAISLALRFLDTLSVVQGREDYVNIMDFSGHGTYRWLNNFKTSTYNKTRDNQNFSVALDGIVGDNIDVSSSPSAADTTNAINIAISELKKIPDVVQVVIVLTASGQNLSNLDITANSGVNLFVYNFGVTAGESQCNQTIRAFSEFIPVERLDNPLYALESYYSFLAKVHASFINYNETIDYGPECPDFTGVDNSTLTMSRAAFDLNGELLGVVGIDFFQNKVNLQYSTFKFSDIVSYVNKYSPNISSAGNISVCFTPYTLKDNCKDFKDSVPDFLCQLSTGDDKIGCCGECKEKEVWRKILGGVAGGIVGLLMIAVIVYFAWRCITRRMKSEKVLAESPQFIFPGPENGTTLQGDTRENFGVKTPE